jgi:hypothetical protein
MLPRFVKYKIYTIVVMYSVFVFSRSEFKKYFNALDLFNEEKRSHIAIENSIQKFGSYNIYKRKSILALILDETIIQIGNQKYWL